MTIFNRQLLTLLFALFAISIMSATSLHAEDIEMVNRPINTNGLTGLLYTTTPYTLAPGVIETGFAFISEDSAIPPYTLNEYPVVIAAGIGHDMELAVRSTYFSEQTGTSSIQRSRGSGNLEVLYKWTIKPQQEYSAMPAVALLFTAILPSKDNMSGFAQVKNWGAHIGISAGSEISWEEHIFGIYADATMALQDLSNSRYRDRYGSMNAGILLPISKQRNLQLFLEYGFVGGKDIVVGGKNGKDPQIGNEVVNVYGLDSSAITYGLRMVSERVNLTIGTQFQHKEHNGYGNSGKVVGMASIKF
jgi:hypothetical protein